MIDYTSIAASAASAIIDAGFATTLRRRGAAAGPEYDPAFLPSVDYPINCVDVTDTASDKVSAMQRKVDTIVVNTKSLLVAANGVTPMVADEILVFGLWMRVETVKSTSPAGTPVIYEAEVVA